MKQMTDNRQLAINLTASIVALAFNFGISFFLSPYIVATLGAEANGFVQLAGNFVSYATLATLAVNSMAGRFITISVAKCDWQEASRYYTAVSYGNIALVVLFLVPAALCVAYLDSIVHISPELVSDVKWLFAFSFLNFLLSTAFSIWNVATFATNKIYLDSLRGMETQVVRAAVIVVAFAVFSPKVFYVGLAASLATIYIIIYNLHYKRTLLPQVRASRCNFSFSSLREVMAAGIWNTVISGGLMLLGGLDLLIANLFIGPAGMGALALGRVFPSAMSQFAGSITSVFMPSLTIGYAKEDKDHLLKELNRSMKITGVLVTIPYACFFVFGQEFFKLWVPSEDAMLLQQLSLLYCFGYIFTSGTQALYNVFTVVNKLKVYSLVFLASGALTTVTVLLLLKATDWGVLAIAVTASVYNLARNLLYAVPMSSRLLGFKETIFYKNVLLSALSVILVVLAGFGVRLVHTPSTWLSLAAVVLATAAIGLATNIMVVLNKDERRELLQMLRRRLHI